MPGVLKGEPVTLAAEAEVRREAGRSRVLPQETDRSDQKDGLARKRDAWLARGLGVADRVTPASTEPKRRLLGGTVALKSRTPTGRV